MFVKGFQKELPRGEKPKCSLAVSMMSRGCRLIKTWTKCRSQWVVSFSFLCSYKGPTKDQVAFLTTPWLPLRAAFLWTMNHNKPSLPYVAFCHLFCSGVEVNRTTKYMSLNHISPGARASTRNKGTLRELCNYVKVQFII